ncbi:MAG: hypothetical protein PHG82_03620 [Candidatus Gracilibacteria bacterium]|nr:hypothetical protein [Candidatus Gracilibacteria bacterium]
MSEYFPTGGTRGFKSQKLTASQKRKLLELYAEADRIREKAKIDAEIEGEMVEKELDDKLDDVF